MTDNVTPAPVSARRGAGLARRDQILDAACQMIFERGYEPVSMAEIGAAVGVSGPAIYRHFQSKSDILNVLCSQTLDRLIEFVGPRRETPLAELRALVEGQVRLVVVYPELVRVYENEERALAPEMRRDIRRRQREHTGRWVAALRQLNPEARATDLEALVYAVTGMILSAPRWPRAVREAAGLEIRLRETAWRMLDLALVPAAPGPSAGLTAPEASA